jgi:hypothetical protein
VSQLLRRSGRKGSGQLFVVHVSGNPGDDLATLKSAKQFLGVRGILVLGHGNCGAVGAPIKTVQSGATLPVQRFRIGDHNGVPIFRCSHSGRHAIDATVRFGNARTLY